MGTATKTGPGKQRGLIRKLLAKKVDQFEQRSMLNRVLVGTLKGTARGLARGGVGAKDATVNARQKIQDARAARHFEAGYEPEPGQIPLKGRPLLGSITCLYCKVRFADPEGLAGHLDFAHAKDTPKAKLPPQPQLAFGRTRALFGKVIVRPVKGGPTGRHRPKSVGPNRRVEATKIVADYNQKIQQIGTYMSDAIRMLRNGYQSMLDDRPRTISQIGELSRGLEAVNAFAAEVFRELRMRDIQRGFDPADVQGYSRLADAFDEASRHAGSIIHTLEANLAQEIAAAKARKAGQTLTDDILAN